MNLLKFLSVVLFFSATLFAVNNQDYFTASGKKNSFSKAYSNLSDKEIDQFMLGKSFFTVPWVEAPSATTARDGLGPLFNANACMSCHPNNTLGSVYSKEGNISRRMVVRLSVNSNNSKKHHNIIAKNGFVPHDIYGAQLSLNGLDDVPYEGKLKITYHEQKVHYSDGSLVTLRKPHYELVHLNYGKIGKNTAISVRKAPPLVGLGLIEQIDNGDILKQEDAQDKNHDGISGRANIVYSVEYDKYLLGKYTYKASAPTVKHQIAAAFHNDMSLTTTLFKNENCTDSQKQCQNAPKARDEIDVPDVRLDAIDFYLTHLKVPVETKKELKGEQLFKQIGCVACHTASYQLKNGMTIHPYSDFLLHDMGKGLSDGRTEFKANAQEWKTPPLWGINSFSNAIGKRVDYLHDGRARNLEEAILWHDGEAKTSKELFMQLNKNQRDLIIKFLGTL